MLVGNLMWFILGSDVFVIMGIIVVSLGQLSVGIVMVFFVIVVNCLLFLL